MNILFIHQNFPAQFKYLAPILANQRGNRVVAIANRPLDSMANIECHYYQIKSQYMTHPFLIEEYSKILRANEVLKLAKKLKQNGFYPDVIYLHPGWGEGLFIKDVWPDSRLIAYFEYFYRLEGQDVGFDPDFPLTEQQQYLLRLKNNVNYQALDLCDQGISPTYWQRSTYPDWAREKIAVIHEGVDTRICHPDSAQSFYLQQIKLRLTGNHRLITYVARHLEPLRGFYPFMRAIPFLLKRYSDIHILIVGKEQSGYGANLDNGKTHKQYLLEELNGQLDPQRVHFVGHLSYEEYLQVLKISTIHFYATYPFVVSWSLLEAMACGCSIVASDVDPVKELIHSGKNGLLFDFFNREQLIEQISTLLENEKLRKKLAKQARKTVKKHYQLPHCIEKQIQLINSE